MPQQDLDLDDHSEGEKPEHEKTIGTFEELLQLDPSQVAKVEVKSVSSPEPEPFSSKVTIPPEEDARLAPLESYIERQWRKFRPKYYALLQQQRRLQQTIHETAIWCVEVLNQFEEKGLGADQGREAIQELIVPEPE